MKYGNECAWTGSLTGIVIAFVLIITFMTAIFVNPGIALALGFLIVVGIGLVINYNESSKSDY